MKTLHILKTEPDEQTKTLLEIVSNGQEATLFKLYEEEADYDALLDLVFDHDKVISWW